MIGASCPAAFGADVFFYGKKPRLAGLWIKKRVYLGLPRATASRLYERLKVLEPVLFADDSDLGAGIVVLNCLFDFAAMRRVSPVLVSDVPNHQIV